MLSYRIIDSQQPIECAEYHRMRHALWPEHDLGELYQEMFKILSGMPFYKNELSWTTFVAVRDNGALAGFIEITVYPELDFTQSKPVGFIEGWYVDEDLRGSGIGKYLTETAVTWLLTKGCTEIASDVEEQNTGSQMAHKCLGFLEAKREEGNVFYKKSIV